MRQRRSMRWMRGMWRPAIPAVAAVVLAVLVRIVGGDIRLRVFVAPWLLLLEVGVLISVAWWWNSRRTRRQQRIQDLAVEQARRSGEGARRRFISRLDHELKNPLTALLASLGGEAGPLASDQRAIARAQADRLRRLLDDLRRVPEIEVVDLDLLASDVEQLLNDAVGAAVEDAGTSRKVHVDVPRAPRPLPLLECDPDLIAVAVANIVANALKYSGPCDVIEVRARESTDEEATLIIEVADSGPGIPYDQQENVWEELARGSAPPDVPGSGIGLALVRAIAIRHGGNAELRSRDGAGTSVFLQLPLNQPS